MESVIQLFERRRCGARDTLVDLGHTQGQWAHVDKLRFRPGESVEEQASKPVHDDPSNPATEGRSVRIALLWRGDPRAENKPPSDGDRLYPVFEALAKLDIAAEPVVYSDDVVEAVHDRLLQFDGVLVWVDPITQSGDRRKLDPMLRSVAAQGVWVSAHPDVILKMGTKDVIFRTRGLGWGTETYRYETIEELRQQLPLRLAAGAPRVLKQYRGNGGYGVWKIAVTTGGCAAPDLDVVVEVQHAMRGSAPEQIELGAFIDRCEAYFARGGCMIDQAYQARLADGMIRCYVVQGQVAGFGHQLIKALLPPPPEGASSEAAQPGPRVMHGAEAPAFQALRTKMDNEWIPAMQRLVDVETSSLPAIWDADFLYGPKTASGEDSYVLCEINVSAVSPFPDQAVDKLARAARDGVLTAKRPRAGPA
jgi:hypothetical protein